MTSQVQENLRESLYTLVGEAAPDDGLVSFDTEGSGLHPDDGARVSVVSVAWREGGVLQSAAFPFDQGPLSDKPGLRPKKGAILLEPGSDDDPNLGPDEYNAILGWLDDKRLIIANAAYDLKMARLGGLRGWEDDTLWDLKDAVEWDTMLASWILWPLQRMALKRTMERLFGLSEGDDEREFAATRKRVNPQYGPGLLKRYDIPHWADITGYAVKDAEQALRLHEVQIALFAAEERHQTRFMDEEMRIMKLLHEMESRGLPYDRATSLVIADELEQETAELAAELPFRLTAPAAAKWFFGLTSEGGQEQMPHCVGEKTGAPSVAVCCVRELTSRPEPVRGVALTYQRANKVKDSENRYYRGYPAKLGGDSRLRTDFKQAGTVNFRFSSGRVNLQALPHDYKLELLPEGTIMPRSLFMDEPGTELWEFDLAQAEYRIAGRLANCERILRYVDEDIDAHSETANLLFGDAEFEHRQVAKRANFSLLFSIGARRFNMDVEKQTGVKLGETRARAIIVDWRKLHPEIPVANDLAENAMKARGRKAEDKLAQGYVRMIDGRFRWLTWDEYSYKAFNCVVQGGQAQGVKKWLLAVDAAYPGMLRLTVHDSIALAIPTERVAEVVAGVVKIGEELLSALFDVKMKVDAKRWKTANLL